LVIPLKAWWVDALSKVLDVMGLGPVRFEAVDVVWLLVCSR
jgi:hypothetical protein